MNNPILKKLLIIKDIYGQAELVSYKNQSYIFAKRVNIQSNVTDAQTIINYLLFPADYRFDPSTSICTCSVNFVGKVAPRTTKVNMFVHSDDNFYVDWMFVLPNYRKHGFASLMYNKVVTDLKQICKNNNLDCTIGLEPIESNEAYGFWESCGAIKNEKFSISDCEYMQIHNPKIKDKFAEQKICPAKVLSVNDPCNEIATNNIYCERE